MREGWEYKKLGEVVDVINGLWTGKKPPFVKVAVVRNTNFTKECTLDMTNVAYIDVEEKQFATRELRYGDIIIEKSGGSDKQPVGRPVFFNIVEGGYSFSNFTASLRIKDEKQITSEFLHKALIGLYKQGITRKLQSKTTGIHNLDFKSYLKIKIPLPPLSVQQSIVSELDEINNLLSLKRKELETFDKLAQSLFYEMFGDPVENEKGWEVKKLSKVSTLLNGRAYRQNELLDTGKYKVLRVGNFFTNGNYYYSDLELEEEKYCNKGDLLFAWSASFGAFIWNGGKVIYHYHIWKVLYDEDKLNIQYYRYLLNTMTSYLMKDVHGIGMVHLTKNGMEQYDIPLPPLPLQQLFAERIEAIEQQNAQVKAAIEKLETLLAARMQYWFD